MGIFGVSADDNAEVLNSLFVHLNHLVGFGSFVDESDIVRNALNTSRERENTLFKFLYSGIAQPNVVVNIGLVGSVGLVVKCLLKGSYRFLVFFIGVISEAKSVQNHWVGIILFEGCLQVFDALFVVFVIIVAQCSVD